jgi:hypothetical protein
VSTAEPARQCPSCARPLPAAVAVCPFCGTDSTASGTTWEVSTLAEPPSPAPGASPTAPLGIQPLRGRFAPGQILASRYRIIDCIGAGGMGEVYHADDLSLEQPLALKFLPPHFAGDPERVRRLKQEVRIARQVSHPNVCRVYDLAEVEGLCFLSMEYVRGEDLRSLLQRIGRLPADKAAQVARQMADGLAAAHERGILHRDLKPANVMLDDRGQVRIMDFGLAALAGTVHGLELLRGTPAYSSPEQRGGRGVTERSDIYCLGLVMYELFTGQRAWSCLGAALLALAVGIGLGGVDRLTGIVPLPKSPEVLAADARATLEALGYPGPARDVSHGFIRRTGYIDWLMTRARSAGWWKALGRGEPSVIRFWYRESPTYLVPYRTTEFFAGRDDPPLAVPGMVRLELDTLGRLRQIEVVPGASEAASREPDFRAVFASAGLDPATFKTVEADWRPSAFADRLAAWQGVYPDAPEIAIRVEAAALRGRLVAFRIVEPWTPASERGPAGFVGPAEAVSRGWRQLVHVTLHFALLAGLGLVARRNLRTGRGDPRFAFRLAFILFAAVIAQWLLAAHHVPEGAELELFFGALYRAFFAFGLGWLFYIVLEPYARKLWPRALVSWIRLLEGRFSDPQLGRDVLFGCFAGIAYSCFLQVYFLAHDRLGLAAPRPDVPAHPAMLLALRGVPESVAELLAVLVNITTHVLFLFVALLLLRFVLRRTWLAIAVHWSAYVLVYGPSFGWLPIAAWITTWHFLFFRYGWLPILVGTFMTDLLHGYPLTKDLAAWNAHPTILVGGVTLALLVYAFRTSLGGRPAVADLLPDE